MKARKELTFALGILIGLPAEASAYIDPTAGGLIMQLLLFGAAGLGVITKLYWKKLTSRFRRRSKNDLDR